MPAARTCETLVTARDLTAMPRQRGDGGNGYMKEYGVERVWPDMRLNRIGAGTDEILLEVIGRSYVL